MVLLAAAVTGQGPLELFNGRDLAGWSTFLPHADGSDPRTDPRGVFTVRDGVLRISGEEPGLLSTERTYGDYRLRVEWRWGDTARPAAAGPRDGGLLLHATGPDTLWTRSILCQIREGSTGDLWLLDGTALTVRGKRRVDGRAPRFREAERPIGEWNVLEVTCQGDRIEVRLNGAVVNEGTGASATRGRVAFQSQGAELLLRSITLEPL
jgi:hypothetical protein